MIKYKKYTLANGLRVILAPMKNTEAITAQVLVKAGSRYETKEINGISHFLEHFFFKGTKNYPGTNDVGTAVVEVGGLQNAFTGNEGAGYWIKVAKDKLPLAIHLLADMMVNPLFPTKELEKEKGVILEERNMYLDDPKLYVAEVLQQLLYGDHPLGWDIVGTEKVIRSLSRKDLTKYHKERYCAKNMLFVLAGNFSENKARQLIKNNFSTLAKKSASNFLPIKINQTKPALKFHYKKTDQAHLILACHSIKRKDPQRYIQDVLSVILGGNMASRLFKEIREKRGLAYYISADTGDFTDTGVLAVNAGLRISAVAEAIAIIVKELARLKKELVSAKELKRAKEYIRGLTSLQLESSSAIAGFLGGQELLDDEIENVEEILKGMDKVSATDIKKFANKYFKNESLNLAIVGPFRDEQKFAKLLKL